MTAQVISISIAATGQTPRDVPNAKLEAGRGIVGDRYYEGSGTFSKKLEDNDKGQITFIAAEEIDNFNAARGTRLNYRDLRRNVVTRGVDLNALAGLDFEIAGVRFRGIELCEPCAYLKQTVHVDVLPHLVNRGGLRAAILSSGTISPQDEIHCPDLPKQESA